MKILSVMLIALLASTIVAAEDNTTADSAKNSGENKRFSNFDSNHDGVVSLEEIAAGEKLATTVTKNWSKIDTNGDSKIDKVEFSSFEKKSNL